VVGGVGGEHGPRRPADPQEMLVERPAKSPTAVSSSMPAKRRSARGDCWATSASCTAVPSDAASEVESSTSRK
jgi:hypothetical protein